MAEAYIGEIRIFAGNFPPQGWEFCMGQTLAITDFAPLYSIIGTFYGGNGVSSFNLPDLRARAPLGIGSGPGLTPRSIGQKGGEPSVALTPNQMPGHIHGMQASKSLATSTEPGSNMLAAGAGRRGGNNFFGEEVNLAPMSPSAVEPTGQGTAHPNMQPYLACNYIICTDGYFPPRS